jgi:hypothetical protein
MARNLEWRDLKIGVIAFTAIVGLALSILFFARVGALHGDTTDIYVVTDDAPGVLAGTEVWLSGQKVGLVKDIHFRPPSTDTLERLAIHLQILSQHIHFIRRDAWADIRPGGNLIGSPVVWISSGTSNARAVNPGDTLVEISTGMMQPVGDRVAALGNGRPAHWRRVAPGYGANRPARANRQKRCARQRHARPDDPRGARLTSLQHPRLEGFYCSPHLIRQRKRRKIPA